MDSLDPRQLPLPDATFLPGDAGTAGDAASLSDASDSVLRESLDAADSAIMPIPILEPRIADHISDLILQIREAAEKLERDQVSRGDLKILSRTLRELRYAFKVFSPYRAQRKVTIFGSARTPPSHPAYDQAVQLGKRMGDEGWLVVTGAASGIMEAGHVGAGRERSMGLNIMLPFEQSANAVIKGDPKLVNMKYFFTRKLMFVKECHAVALLPGGFGTLDEGLEVLTLLQTGKRELVPVVFLDPPGGDFWPTFNHFIRDHLLAEKLISPEDLELYKLTDSVDEAVAEITQFYKVYHSQRYVKNKLVLRLQSAPSPELLDGINAYFPDILVEGQFEVSGPLPDEQDDEAAGGPLTRLVFRFNRRDHGRLRRLINCINSGRIGPEDAKKARVI